MVTLRPRCCSNIWFNPSCLVPGGTRRRTPRPGGTAVRAFDRDKAVNSRFPLANLMPPAPGIHGSPVKRANSLRCRKLVRYDADEGPGGKLRDGQLIHWPI